jgi:hypothetical protein
MILASSFSEDLLNKVSSEKLQKKLEALRDKLTEYKKELLNDLAREDCSEDDAEQVMATVRALHTRMVNMMAPLASSLDDIERKSTLKTELKQRRREIKQYVRVARGTRYSRITKSIIAGTLGFAGGLAVAFAVLVAITIAATAPLAAPLFSIPFAIGAFAALLAAGVTYHKAKNAKEARPKQIEKDFRAILSHISFGEYTRMREQGRGASQQYSSTAQIELGTGDRRNVFERAAHKVAKQARKAVGINDKTSREQLADDRAFNDAWTDEASSEEKEVEKPVSPLMQSLGRHYGTTNEPPPPMLTELTGDELAASNKRQAERTSIMGRLGRK